MPCQLMRRPWALPAVACLAAAVVSRPCAGDADDAVCGAPLVPGSLARSPPESGESPESRRPKYARVDGDIETMWQLPAVKPKGIFFIAHGCQHQGTDVFSDVGPDGWRLQECSASNTGRCLGLPEEVKLRQAARRRGYVVMSVSGGKGSKSCWDMQRDVARVVEAVKHVRTSEGLPEDFPVLATGASSGGAFVGRLASPGGLQHLQCIVPQISRTSGENRGVPTLYVHMPKDMRIAAYVEGQIEELRERGVRAGELKVKAMPVTEELLGRCLPPDAARDALRALRDAGVLDARGMQKASSRKRMWVEPLKRAVGDRTSDTFESDESCVSELMNVADAVHEFTAEFSDAMIDFCEGKDVF